MIRNETVRTLALALPDVEERDHVGFPSFRAYGGKFCTLFPDERRASLGLGPAEQAEVCREHPEAFSPVEGGFGRMGHTWVDLTRVERAAFQRALGLAWTRRAKLRGRPKR